MSQALKSVARKENGSFERDSLFLGVPGENPAGDLVCRKKESGGGLEVEKGREEDTTKNNC